MGPAVTQRPNSAAQWRRHPVPALEPAPGFVPRALVQARWAEEIGALDSRQSTEPGPGDPAAIPIVPARGQAPLTSGHVSVGMGHRREDTERRARAMCPQIS